jgi:signal transduction histidine kinase
MKLRAAVTRLGSWMLGVSVRVKIMGIALSMIFLLSFVVNMQARMRLSENLTEELQRRGESIARDLAARSTTLILTNNLYGLHELAHDTMDNNSDVRYVMVLNDSQKVLVDTFPHGVPRGLLFPTPVHVGQRSHIEALETEEGTIYDVAVPILEGRAGLARVGMTTKRIPQASTELTSSLLKATLVVSVLAVLAAYGLTQLLIRPLFQLRKVAGRVGEGLFDLRAPVYSTDEIGQLTTSFNNMTESLGRMQKELQWKEEMRLQLLDKLMTVQEEERKRIARELHDETSQALTSLMIGLKLLEQAPTAVEANRQIEELRLVTMRTLEEVHRLALELRPGVLDDCGLEEALRKLGKDFAAKTGLDVDCQIVGSSATRLQPQVEIAVYRIVQEALTNVVRHAVAGHVSVVLNVQRDSVRVVIEDDGCGFDVSSVLVENNDNGKLGLFGMKERAALFGGKLTVESRPGGGTTLVAVIPVPASAIAGRFESKEDTNAAHSNIHR